MPYFSFDKIQIGPIVLYTWGAFLALAFLYALFFILREAKKKGIDAEIIISSFSWLIIGTIIGARLGYVVQFLDYYFAKPVEILKIWQGGMTFHGGLFGLLIAAIIYAKFAKIGLRLFLQIADLAVLAAPISIAITRIGCSLINDHQGAETSLPWGIIWPDGAIRHPVAEYLIISALILYLILRFLRPKLTKPGQLFIAFFFLYSVFRFFLDFTRSTGTLLSDPQYLGLSTAQWLSLAIILGIIIKSCFLKKRSNISI